MAPGRFLKLTFVVYPLDCFCEGTRILPRLPLVWFPSTTQVSTAKRLALFLHWHTKATYGAMA